MRAGAPSRTAAARSAAVAAAAPLPLPLPSPSPLRGGRRHPRSVAVAAAAASREVTLLDYGAGNVRSVRNAIKRLGWTIKDVESPRDLLAAERVVFPGVGTYGQAVDALRAQGLLGPLREYLQEGRPFFGICLGLQLLFEGSDESGGVEGLGIIPGRVEAFDPAAIALPVPHIGWNTLDLNAESAAARELLAGLCGPSENGPSSSLAERVYFVHTYCATPSPQNRDWVAATSEYGAPFVAAVAKGQVSAAQFHPEKSGAAGLRVLGNFLAGGGEAGALAAERAGVVSPPAASSAATGKAGAAPRGLARRVIACLDVRANDDGDLVVTKGDQYDVREPASSAVASSSAAAEEGVAAAAVDERPVKSSSRREVRNLGKPVELAARYFDEGADEVAFLNITGFRDCPVADLPMLAVLRAASERVFVPMTVGGGIRGFSAPVAAADAGATEGGAEQTPPPPQRRDYSALEVASAYFRSGADKVSIGSDAVEAALELRARGGELRGDTAIEQISGVYGKQAVVVSIDPRRVFLPSEGDAPAGATALRAAEPGPNGEQWCWWQATVKGGREGRDIDAVELARACERLGAGEIMLNAIDNDGTGKGFDLALVGAVSEAVGVPVVASSGAGNPSHFTEVFQGTRCSAALAAGIFHRREVAIADVKAHMAANGLPARV